MSQDYTDLYGAPQTSAPPADDTPPKPFVLNSADAEPQPQQFAMNSATQPPPFPMNGVPQQNPYYAGGNPPPFTPNAMPMQRPLPPPRPVQPPKPKQPFSPIPLLLIAGVGFLFLGGVLVLTNTWASLPDIARALALLSVGIISFGVNVLAEKVFRLPKTGLAFYILGCIFLPLAIAGIGAFKLFGDWYTFDGDGSPLLCATISACLGIAAFAGVRNYKHAFLAWLSLAAAAVSWFCLDCQLVTPFHEMADWLKLAIVGGTFLVFCILATVWNEWILRRHADSPFGKAAKWFLLPLLIISSLLLMAADMAETAPAVTIVLAVLLSVLFFNKRFIEKSIHLGVIGIAVCALIVCSNAASLTTPDGFMLERFLFAITGASAIMAVFCNIPKLYGEMRNPARVLSLIMSLPMLLAGTFLTFWRCGEPVYPLILGSLLIISLLFFILTRKNPLSKDTPLCAAAAVMMFDAALIGIHEDSKLLMSLLLVMTAVLLLVQAFLCRRMWYFVVGIASCGAMLLLQTPHPLLWILWMVTGILLAGVVYSHIAKRLLREKSFYCCLIPFLLIAGGYTMFSVFEIDFGFTSLLLFAALTLLYLLEAIALSSHLRTNGTVLFLEILSVIAGFTAFIPFLISKEPEPGKGFLLMLMLGIFSVVCTRKRINFWAVLPLGMLFFTANHMIRQISDMRVTGWGIPLPGSMTPENMAVLIKVGCYLLLLVLFAVMGRVLLPKFFDSENEAFRVDFPLLAGIFPIIGVTAAIKWYPEILICLFLTCYSLLFIGRLKNRSIPALLASLFGCATILMHNIDDPFGLLEKLSVLDIKTIRIILYLLPFHVFIFTLLFILPEKLKNGVHIARFVMYCVTMLTLLFASLNFGQVADALILVALSLAILISSFAVKRLRWFTLGFSVLVITTINLTWAFWTSLHWGIYLFLAGILLIAIASVYEYSARYAREHPDEPKKKFRLFSTWRW